MISPVSHVVAGITSVQLPFIHAQTWPLFRRLVNPRALKVERGAFDVEVSGSMVGVGQDLKYSIDRPTAPITIITKTAMTKVMITKQLGIGGGTTFGHTLIQGPIVTGVEGVTVVRQEPGLDAVPIANDGEVVRTSEPLRALGV